MSNMMGTDCVMGWGMILVGALAAGLALLAAAALIKYLFTHGGKNRHE
ncbi:hypothetical protein KFF05_03820 [bacterium SCSIO 12827]|nr:hypothetical protein KFF05_03820 [bacterium SCSIO 12827]